MFETSFINHVTNVVHEPFAWPLDCLNPPPPSSLDRDAFVSATLTRSPSILGLQASRNCNLYADRWPNQFNHHAISTNPTYHLLTPSKNLVHSYQYTVFTLTFMIDFKEIQHRCTQPATLCT
jgi:hypothetical protein